MQQKINRVKKQLKAYLKMGKTILMYWPKEGNVENCANKITKAFGDLEMKSINEVSLEDLKSHDHYIIGCSTVGSETWDNTANSDPWPAFINLVEKISLTTKSIALYGLGDQVRWPKHYVDGMAVLFDHFVKRGAKMVGKWPVEGYDHDESEAQNGDFFCGLALDEDIQPELSEERIDKWVKQIKEEF